MCGIVGYLDFKGQANSIDIVLEGLKRLEYRGYDSAGVSFLDQSDNLITYKKAGALVNLENHLPQNISTKSLAIGHTRWATHGVVSDLNAHPHESQSWALVHNGIIENFSSLKQELIKDGVMFQSETDSEVFVHLLRKYDVGEAFSKVEGNSAFLGLDRDKKRLFAIKRGAPLVLGRSSDKNEVMISSDPYALVGRVSELIFPEDNVLCMASQEEGLQFFELDGSPSKRYILRDQKMDFKVSTKGDYQHFMLKEIFEQPQLARELFAKYKSSNVDGALAKFKKEVDFHRLSICACGTAYYAGLVIRDFFEKFNRIPTRCYLASEFRYRNPIIENSTHSKELALLISQSGETADTLAALELYKQNKIVSSAILNVEGSSLFRQVDHNFLIHAGTEIGVASTKAYTQMCLTGRLLSAYLQSEDEFNKLEKKFELFAQRVEELLNRANLIEHIARDLADHRGYFFTGRGVYYPVALEGALKLKEIAYVHAEGYASGELKHGPLALIDPEMVNIALVGPELYDKTFSNLKEIKARKGKVLGIGPRGDKNLELESDYYIPLDFAGLEELSPVYVNIVNQLFSYYMAKFLGHDIDKPRNLAKSVTVE